MKEKILKYTDITILTSIALLIFLAVSFPAYPDITRTNFYSSIMLFAGFLFVMSGKLLKKSVKIDTPIDGYIFMIFIWMLFCAPFSINIVSSINSIFTFSSLILLFYITYNYSKKYFSVFALFILVIGTVLSVYGLYQYFAGYEKTLTSLSPDMPFYQDIKFRLESKRIFSTFVYPNAFASFLIMVLPLAVGFFKTEKKLRPFTGIAIIIYIINLILTKSMGAFISITLSLFIIMFSIQDTSLKNLKRFLLWSLAASVAAGVIVFYLRGAHSILTSLSGKLESYPSLLALFTSKIMTGSGPGNFAAAYNAADTHKYLAFAHNSLMQTGIETGIAGIFLFLILFFRGYRSIFNNFIFLRTPQTKAMVISIMVGITAFLIHSMADIGIYFFELAVFFTILSAMLLSQVTIGLLELKKIKFSYLLGINPSSRRTMIYYLILAVLAVSIITGGRQAYAFAAINIILVSGFLVWSISKEDFRHTLLDIPLVSFLAVAMLSLVYTPDLHTGTRYFVLIFMSATAYYLSSQFLRRIEYRIIITNYIVWLGIILSITVLSQFTFSKISGIPVVLDAFFPNQNLLAGYMIIPFSLLLNKILIEKKISYLRLKILTLFLFIGVESLILSKAGILAMILVFTGSWIYYNYHKQNVKDAPHMSVFKSRFMKFILIVFILASFTKITPTGRDVINIKEDPFYFNRINIYKSALKMFADKPLTGHGIGSFKSIFPRYNFPIDSAARYQKEAKFAHNEYLETAASLGILGLFLMLALFIIILKNFPAYEGHKKMWAAATGSYFALAGTAFHALFDFNLHLPGILITCAVLTSIVIKEKMIYKTVDRDSLLFTRTYYIPALLLAFGLIVAFTRPAVSRLNMELYKSKSNVTRLMAAVESDPVNSSALFELGYYYEKQGRYNKATQLYEKLLLNDKNNYITLLHLARINAITRDFAKTKYFYLEALNANPYRAFSYSELAGFYHNYMKDDSSAKFYLEKASTLEPNFAQARYNLALIYKSEGDHERALAELDSIENAFEDEFATNEYEESILDFPKKELLYLKKATLLKDMEKYQDSCYYYRKVLKLSKSEEALQTITELCEKEKINACCGQ